MERTEEKKPKLEMDLESMESIEERVHDWMIMDEHWTQYNLDRRQQLENAQRIFKQIISEIHAAYKTCPAYSEA